MLKGLFVNQQRANCSIYEAGVMIKDALMGGEPEYSLDYIETDRLGNLLISHAKYDFYVFNWHPFTLPITQKNINRLKGTKIIVVLEVTPTVYLPYTPPVVDAYMIIDPTKERIKNYYPFPRPLEVVSDLKPLLSTDKTVIGGFGLVCPTGAALLYKRFYEVVENANKIGNCIVRFNFPEGKFTGIPLSMLKQYGDTLKRLANSDVEVIVTHDYMSKPDLIRWCSEHTINSFPYYRNLSGLSAVTDQAVSAGRPIAVTDCNTFRHLHKYISYYPKQSYQQLIHSTVDGVKQMQEDWHPSKFREKFKELLHDKGLI